MLVVDAEIGPKLVVIKNQTQGLIVVLGRGDRGMCGMKKFCSITGVHLGRLVLTKARCSVQTTKRRSGLYNVK